MTGFWQTTSGHPTTSPPRRFQPRNRANDTRNSDEHASISYPSLPLRIAYRLSPAEIFRHVAHHVVGRYVDPAMPFGPCWHLKSDKTATAGFKKNVNRATTQVMMKTGALSARHSAAPEPRSFSTITG